MRKFYLLFALLLPISLFSQSGYQHYLDTTVTWFEYHGWTFGNDGGERYTRYHVIGEDSFAGESWYLIHEDWTETSQVWPNQPFTTTGQSPNPGNYRLREDSLGNIWTIDPNSQTSLLYEFRSGLTVGDTLWMYNHMSGCKIGQIDTVYLGTNSRARYWCDCWTGGDPEFVIEGVGYNRGFNGAFNWLCQMIWDNYIQIVCHQKQGDNLVVDSTRTCGIPPHYPPIGIEDPLNSALTVRWDAAHGQLILHSEEIVNDFHWEVHDLSGHVLAQGNTFSERLLLPEISTGMYVFVGTYDRGRKVARFLAE